MANPIQTKHTANLHHRQNILMIVYHYVQNIHNFTIPSYKVAVSYLNKKGLKTIRGNDWTSQRLFRFLQNAGVSGLWGIKNLKAKPNLLTVSNED
jgi:hypothetical protein